MDPPARSDLTTLHVRRALDGDSESLGWIVRRFSPLLRVQAAFRLGSTLSKRIDPDDIVAEAWLIALRKLPEFDTRASRSTPIVLAFLAQTVRFVANNALRLHLRGEARMGGRPRSGTDPLDEVAAQIVGAVNEAVHHETGAAIARAVAELDEADRQILVMRGIEGLSNKEIGELVGEKANTISHRYGRALENLRRRLPESIFSELDE